MTRNRILQALAYALTVGLATSPAHADTERYIVQFKDGRANAGYRALSAAGASVRLSLDSVNAAAVEIPAQALQGLSNNPNIEYIEVDPKRYPMALSDIQTTPYGISLVQAVGETNSGGVTVCVIDSGYDLGHPDLPITGVSGSYGSAGHWSVDGLGHGTHVAGTIAALDNTVGVVGVNPGGNNLNLHIVRVFDGAGSFSYASGLVAALEDCETAGAVNEDVTVVNMSLGGSFKSRTEDRAFSAANDRGVLSIAAAGNGGNSRHSYPASYSSVISVAAVDENKNHASFSQTTSQVELAGPGVHVLSTVPQGTGSEGSAMVDGTTYFGDAMDGSAIGEASGTLVDCGLGTSPCPARDGKVCLIQRGDISFADKVAACQDGGGSAAIIYNNVAGPLLGTLGDQTSSIPVIGVSDVDGAAMQVQADLGQSASVTVAVSDYAFYDGTSMATPHVAGVAALVWSKHASCSNQEIRNALATTALDLGASGRDDLYGYGLVQAASAIAHLTANGCGGSGGGGGGGDDSGGGGGGNDKCHPRRGCN